MIGFLFGLFFGGLIGFFTLAVCVAAQDKEPQPVERAYRDGYEQGLRDFAEMVEETTWYHINAKGELVIGANSETNVPLYKAEDIYQIAKEMGVEL